MSLSREARIENMGDALRLMMEEAGERHFEGVFIDANGSQYDGIENTTWKELIDRGFIKEITRYGHVAFTGYGWRIAMINLKRHESEDFKQRLSRLSAALKDSIKGRDNPALIGTHDLTAQTGLTWDFIVNVLKSNMIEEVFKVKGAEITDDRVVITVPIDYGLRPL